MKKVMLLMLLLSSTAIVSGPLSGVLAYAATKVLCNSTIQVARPTEPHLKAPSTLRLEQESMDGAVDKTVKTIEDSGLGFKAMEVTNSTVQVVGDENLPIAVEAASFSAATLFFWLPLP